MRRNQTVTTEYIGEKPSGQKHGLATNGTDFTDTNSALSVSSVKFMALNLKCCHWNDRPKNLA